MPSEMQNLQNLNLLRDWHNAVTAAQKAKEIIEQEQELRKKVFSIFFPVPVEGSNTFQLPESWTLRAMYKIERKVDEAALPVVAAKLYEMKVNPDLLTRTKIELDLKNYRSLVELNQEAAKVFEEALIIKPGSPTLELVAPKEKKA